MASCIVVVVVTVAASPNAHRTVRHQIVANAAIGVRLCGQTEGHGRGSTIIDTWLVIERASRGGGGAGVGGGVAGLSTQREERGVVSGSRSGSATD